MSQLTLSCPVLWPQNRPRTPNSQRIPLPGAKGDMSYSEAIGLLREALSTHEYRNPTLYTCYQNVENDRQRKRVDPHNGVSLLLSLHGVEYLLACDSWTLTQQNIYAIYLLLNNLHQLERWGVGDIAVFLEGFRTQESRTAALAQAKASSGLEPWRETLGLGPTAKLIDANATYRVRAKENADNEDELTKLNKAIEEARKALR
jgi:hypothetical protein